MADVNRLSALGMAVELAAEVASQIEAGGAVLPVSSDDVTVPEITADEFTFAGGTLTAFAQAIADAIPPA